LGVDVADDQAARLELIGDGLHVLGVDLAAGGDAREVNRAEDGVGHDLGPASEISDGAAHRPVHTAWTAGGPPFPPAASPPIRRRSSSGLVARCSASWRVILPERTSAASAESIVCMPA